MIQERDLGWLAGIIDGEGTITICRIKGFMRPIVQIVNTNTSMLLKVNELLEKIISRKLLIGVVKSYGKEVLACYRIQSVKQSDVEKILLTIKPYLVAKTEQARLVLEFLEIRKHVIRRPRIGIHGGQHRPYSDREENILAQVKFLNNYRTRRDCTFGTSKEVMRQSELHSDMQSKAEMPLPSEN
jgi:hypothetical protein